MYNGKNMLTNLDTIKHDIVDMNKLSTYDGIFNVLRQMSVVDIPNRFRSDYTTYPIPFLDTNIILTQEFLEGLYKEMRRRRFTDIPMVEICAGRGKLSYQLRKRGIDIVATDDFSQEIERDENLVERLTHKEALEKYQPRIIVASWIPPEPKIGDDVLRFPTVDYFIDIGEPAGNSTWLTNDYRNEDFIIKFLKHLEKYAIGTGDYFVGEPDDEMTLTKHTEVRLWKRRGAPMGIDHSVR